MTDHLESYRRMARSIRFFPPVSLTQPSQESVAAPVTPESVNWSSKKTVPDAEVSAVSKPAIDPSEHVAALVDEAVQKPTVLPVTYTILENIGDRISRLATPKPVNPIILQPKIPQPDPNWTPPRPIEPQPINIEAKKQIDDTHQETSPPATVVTEAPPVASAHSDDSVAVVVEPVTAEETPQEQTSAAAIAESVTAEETPQEQTSATVIAAPVKAEETASDDTVAVVAEPVEVEQTTDDTSVDVVTEPITVPETTGENHPDTESPVAEAPTEQAPTLLERVSSIVEAVSTAFKNPDAEKDSETVVKEPSASDSTGTEAATADTVEPLTTDTSAAEAPTLLQRVSSVVEAVTTAFKNPDDQQESEAVVEPASKAIATETPREDTGEPLTTEVLTAEVPNTKTPSLKDSDTDKSEAEDKPKQKPNSHVEAAKATGSELPTMSADSSSKSSKPRSQKKTKAKGFGGSKKAK